MDKLIINNQEVELLFAGSIANGIVLETNKITIQQAEELFPTNEIVAFKLANASNVIYGIYSGLKAYSIAKISEEKEDGTVEDVIQVKFGIVNKTTERINQLEETVDTLVLAQLGL